MSAIAPGAKQRALVIGHGSIGRRHVEVLSGEGFEVDLVTSQVTPARTCHENVPEALRKKKFDLVVVANPASAHMETLSLLAVAGFTGRVLIEKPLSNQHFPVSEISEQVRVGYNLRFLPIVGRIRELIAGRKLYSINAYVGQYLPTWRPATDYRTAVSARRSLGGGALRELSHELDLVQHLAGSWKRVVAMGGRVSALEIDVEDQFSLMMECANCPLIQVSVNFLDRVVGRSLIINAEGLSLHADLRTGYLSIGGDAIFHESHATAGRNDSYRGQLREILAGGAVACNWSEAMDVVDLVLASEESAARTQWITK